MAPKTKSTAYVVHELKHMILTGGLLPGQSIRQEVMADVLGVSRLPVREALRQLTAEGLVRHTPNAGFTVTRLNHFEFAQIYRMRRVLETDLLIDLPEASGEQLLEIERLRDLVAEAAGREDLVAMQAANHAFHFAIFRVSDAALVINEIERIWTWSAPYQATYLSSPHNRRTILAEHDLLVDAVRQGDGRALADLMEQHRRGSASQVGPTLSHDRTSVDLTSATDQTVILRKGVHSASA